MTFELDDRCRQAINAHKGKRGKASRKEIINEFDAVITAHFEDLTDELDKELGEEEQ